MPRLTATHVPAVPRALLSCPSLFLLLSSNSLPLLTPILSFSSTFQSAPLADDRNVTDAAEVSYFNRCDIFGERKLPHRTISHRN
ncbi:hypothetical protein C8R47DRAFT_755475 [Mycena vitilis]|nr:hypothetical protein C8R47DRAFT_755475 [Mycena vitilis]